MARGQRLFHGLVYGDENKGETGGTEVCVILEAGTLTRGRSEELITNRNECIVCRYYYYTKIKRMRYEDVLEILSHEFFLKSRTITDMFAVNSELVKTIFKEKLSIKELEKKFNYLNLKIIKTL